MKINKIKIFSLIFCVALFSGIFFLAMPVGADQSLRDSQIGLSTVGQKAYGNERPQDIRITIAKVINVAMGFLTVIFLGLTIAAGFMYMTSAGNEEKVKKAVGLLKNALIGLIIVLMSWAITRYAIVILRQTVANNVVDYRFYSK